MKILYKYPTRSRRSLFLRGVESIIKNSASDNYHILVGVEPEVIDPTMYPLPELGCSHSYFVEKTINKVHAYNNGINNYPPDWDILVTMSDDMVFTQKGFDNIIRDEFYFKSSMMSSILDRDVLTINRDILLHFPDGNRNDLITLGIMGKDYYNRFKYVYHPSYISVYCDNEQMEVAKQLGCYKYVDRQIFEHKHPAYGKGNMDELYVKNESYYRADEANFRLRQLKGFPICD